MLIPSPISALDSLASESCKTCGWHPDSQRKHGCLVIPANSLQVGDVIEFVSTGTVPMIPVGLRVVPYTPR